MDVFLTSPIVHNVAAYAGELVSQVWLPCVLLLSSWQLWHIYVQNQRDHQCSLPLPPGAMGMPFVGETLSFILKGIKFQRERRESYGNVYKTHLLGRPTVRVIGPENVRKILVNEHKLVTTQWPLSARMILGEGALAMLSGHAHRLRKKVVLKAFAHDALVGYVRPMQEIVRDHVIDWTERKQILAFPECKRLMFSVSGTVLLGFDMSEQEKAKLLTTFHQLTDNLFSLPINLPGTGLNKGLRAREALLSEIEKCIARRDQNPDLSYSDGLSIMLRHLASDELTKEELKEASLEMLFASHATVSSAACSALMYLAQHPSTIERALQELTDHGLADVSPVQSPLVGAPGDLSLEVINKLQYINGIVKEVLRLMPPVGGAFRRALQTFEIDGYQIPQDWSIVYAIRDTQQGSTAFSDADHFSPDRWLELDEEDLNRKLEYIPFGKGSRSCAGKEFAKLLLKVFVIEVVRNSSWRLSSSSVELSYFPVPHPKDNMPIEVRPADTFRRRAFSM